MLPSNWIKMEATKGVLSLTETADLHNPVPLIVQHNNAMKGLEYCRPSPKSLSSPTLTQREMSFGEEHQQVSFKSGPRLH